MQPDQETLYHALREEPMPDVLLQASPDGLLLVDAQGGFTYANPSGLALLGLHASATRSDFFDCAHARDREALRLAFADIKPGESATLEFHPRDGAAGPLPRLQATVRNRLDDAGIRGYLVGLRATCALPPQGRPAPERRKSDADLRLRSLLLSAIMDKLPMMACRIDAQGSIRESFGAGLRSAGLAEGQAVGMNALRDWPEAWPMLQRAYGGETVQFEHENRTTRRVFDNHFVPDPMNPGEILGFAIDITERKHAEEELGKSEALNRRIIESSRDCIILLDVDGRVLSISKNGRNLLEIDDSESVINTPWLDFWKDGERPKAEAALASAMARGVGKFHGFCLTAKARPKWWDVMLTPILGCDEKPERILAVARDITETKEFEETLRRSRDQLEAVLKAITDAVVVTDGSGRVVYANDAAARLLGVASARDLLGSALETLMAAFEIRDEAGQPAEGLLFPALLRARAAKGTPCPVLRGRLVRFRRRGSLEERWLAINSTHIQDADGGNLLYIDTAYDVTDRKTAEDALRKSEEQLRQAQKMEAMGRLAGGVAHDFNNLLTAINGYGEILAHSMADDDPLRANVEEIRRAGERAASLTRQLLTFSRKQVLSKRVVDLNESVAEIRGMLVRLIGEDIELVTSAHPDLARVSADPGQIEQVILNLALNARDAMPLGGRLIIETDNAALDPRQSGVYFPVDVGPYVRLTVTDTGFGMSDEVKAHLFEPFFTTKAPGQGTGLGLSTVYGIVKQGGGNISLRSEPGRGTSVTVFFPALTGEPPCETPAPPEIAPLARPKETVLLAEDEEVVRRLVFQLLTTHGYRVLPAGSGPEALELAARHQGRIDLLLTDVVMVGMSGRELAEKLILARPETKVLYMSGYTDDAIIRHGVFQNSASFLGKPFGTAALIHKIRDVLQIQESKTDREGRLPALAEFR